MEAYCGKCKRQVGTYEVNGGTVKRAAQGGGTTTVTRILIKCSSCHSTVGYKDG